MKPKACKTCSSPFHGAWQHKERKPMNRGTTMLKTIKPMNKTGRVSRRTANAVANWRKTIKPNHQGFYTCHYCNVWTKDPVTEHMESKARRPDLRTTASNFVIACVDCNGKKLSKSHDEFCTVCT